MPEQPIEFACLLQHLENDLCLAEGLFFQEVAILADGQQRGRKQLERLLAESYLRLPASARWRHHLASEPVVRPIEIELEPPRRQTDWREPIMLPVHAVCWSHGSDAHLAYVPALQIVVPAETEEDLLKRLPEEILYALRRANLTGRLEGPARLARIARVELATLPVAVDLKTPKQLAMEDLEKESPTDKVLREVGTNLTQAQFPPAYEVSEVVEKLAEALVGRTPQSVLLVGPSGVGKTAVFHELVRRRHDFQLRETPFWATSGARLIAGMTGFGMWQERCRNLVREASALKAILHLGNLVELVEVGKAGGSGFGIAAFLRPYLVRGDVLAVAECTPQQFALLEREQPQLVSVFHSLQLEEPDADRGRKILAQVAARHKHGQRLTPGGLDALDRLHRRYATYSSYPGRPLRFLKTLLDDRSAGDSITPVEVTAAFSRETGLPQFLLDDAEQIDLAETNEWFGRRVLGQGQAVDLIVDLLAMVKAGLTRPGRPIASLLFIGPTGVGKTEMAKSLAEFFYQDQGRMVRFDMSEYADPLAVNQLIGAGFGSEGLLTSKVREQPFGVVLFDEFEKAHPLFFDLLLQILGEGRLTDAGGRLANFSNAVIVMTSNLGAEQFQQGNIGFGEKSTAGEQAQAHFLRHVRDFLRPELFNRIDRVVPFLPLSEAIILRIAQRELADLARRDGLACRNIKLEQSEELARWVARIGFDVRYGARPLKRAIERNLLAPLAAGMNDYTASHELEANLNVQADGIRVHVRAVPFDRGRTTQVHVRDQAIRRATDLRRDTQRLQHCSAVVDLYSERYRIERIEQKHGVKAWEKPHVAAELAALPRLRELIGRIETLAKGAAELEEELLLELHQDLPWDEELRQQEQRLLKEEWEDIVLALYTRGFEQRDSVLLVVYSESVARRFQLAEAYYRTATETATRIDVYELRNHQVPSPPGCRLVVRSQLAVPDLLQVNRELDGKQKGAGTSVAQTTLDAYGVDDPHAFLAEPNPRSLGIALQMNGPMFSPLFEPEAGLHVFTSENGNVEPCLVDTAEGMLVGYHPPQGIERKGNISGDTRRTYNLDRRAAWQSDGIGMFEWDPGEFHRMLNKAIWSSLAQNAAKLLFE